MMTAGVTTIGALVERQARERRDQPFLLFEDETVTFGDLDERSDAVAAYLQSRGVKQDEVVAFMMGNSPEFFYVLLGAQKIGALAAPISCWWQAGEVLFLVDDARPPVLFMDATFEIELVPALCDHAREGMSRWICLERRSS